MANIDQYLDEIEVASRGEEVRDSIIDAFEALNSEGPGTMIWDNITDTPDTLTGYGVSEVPASMVSGVLALNNIPPSALERVVPVADDTARFALTSSDVQNGDTVKVLSTLKLYLVVDDTSLSTEAGYEEYRAGTADSVDWSGVLNTPDTLAGYGIEDAYTKDEVDDITTSEEEESDAGNPIVVETDAAQYAKNTHLTLAPVQDLHGYDHPWAGGAGKNKLPMTVAEIKAANTSGTWNGNAYTYNGIVYTILTDSDENVIGINVNGSANSASFFGIAITLPSGNYIFNGCPQNGASNTYRVDIRNSIGGTLIVEGYDTGSGNALQLTENTTCYYNIRIESGYNAQNLLFKPMIRLSTESDATFAPYSNICPISGLDEVEVNGEGFNQWDEEWEVGRYNTTTGDKESGNNVRSKNSIQIFPNTRYFIKCPSGIVMTLLYYDTGNNYISVAYVSNEIITTPTNVNYMTFMMAGGYGTTYNHDICINISDPDKNGTYEPYKGYTASLDLPEPVYSGILDLETGEVVVDMAMVDLGSLGWTKNTNYNTIRFISSTNLTDAKKPASNTYPANVIATNYPNYATNTLITDMAYGISVSDQGIISVKDPALSSGTADAFKAASNGSKLVYELATPITYALTPQQLALFKGINNISTNAKTVQVTYRNGELATTGDIVESAEVAKQNAIGESASYTDARLATELAPILGDLATAETSPTSASHAVGEYLLYNKHLYKVLAAISAGQQLTIGTNVGQTNVAAELASFSNRIGNANTISDAFGSDSIKDGINLFTFNPSTLNKPVNGYGVIIYINKCAVGSSNKWCNAIAFSTYGSGVYYSYKSNADDWVAWQTINMSS